MKTNVTMLNVLTIFNLLVAGIYGFWTYTADGEIEVIGFAALTMLVFLTGFISFYLAKSAKNFVGPEDNPDANIEDGEAEMGFFAPWSWWPLVLGVGCALSFTALAVGWWLFALGFVFSMIGLIGFVFEHSRGQHAH
ncbi:MAG: hypothetical protein RLZZ606_496 [Actinomycetota bacterium]|jgi:hypothetical protein